MIVKIVCIKNRGLSLDKDNREDKDILLLLFIRIINTV